MSGRIHRTAIWLAGTRNPIAQPPGDPTEKKASQDIQCIMHVLDKQQESYEARNDQRHLFIRRLDQTEIQKEHGGCMPGEKEIPRDEPVVTVEEITQGVYQSDQTGRRFERKQGDANHPEEAQ